MLQNTELDIELGERIGKGGNCTCYKIEDEDSKVALQHTSGYATNPKEILRSERELYKVVNELPKKVNVARCHGLGLKDGKATAILDKAPGQEIHEKKPLYESWSETLFILAQAPQSTYNQLVRDIKVISEAGLSVDPSKPTNFFYDSDEEVFTLIDLHKTQNDTPLALTVPLLHTAVLFNTHRDSINQRNITHSREIILKLNTSLKGTYGKVSTTEKDIQSQILQFIDEISN